MYTHIYIHIYIYIYIYILLLDPGSQPGPGVRARNPRRDPMRFPPHRISPPSGDLT